MRLCGGSGHRLALGHAALPVLLMAAPVATRPTSWRHTNSSHRVLTPPPLPQLVPPENLLDAAARNFFINVLSGDLAAQPVDGVPLKPTELTPAARNLGWRRMALQARAGLRRTWLERGLLRATGRDGFAACQRQSGLLNKYLLAPHHSLPADSVHCAGRPARPQEVRGGGRLQRPCLAGDGSTEFLCRHDSHS